jgi:hypothetical protein
MGMSMAKPLVVCGLCIMSAAFGAATDRYIGKSIQDGVIDLVGGTHLQQAVSPKAAVAGPADSKFEVLGDRVRCDVRYQELKIPAEEYPSFKRKCMGENYSDND